MRVTLLSLALLPLLLLAAPAAALPYITLSAKEQTAPGSGLYALNVPSYGTTHTSVGKVLEFTIAWDVQPANGTTLSFSCSSYDGNMNPYLEGGAFQQITFAGGLPASPVTNSFTWPTNATTHMPSTAISCTVYGYPYDSIANPGVTVSFYAGPRLEIPYAGYNPVAPGASRLVSVQMLPSDALSAGWINANATFNVSCGAGVISGSGFDGQYFTYPQSAGTNPMSLSWTAPAIPQSSIACSFKGPAPAVPTGAGPFDYMVALLQVPQFDCYSTFLDMVVGVNSTLNCLTSGASLSVPVNVSVTCNLVGGGAYGGAIPDFTIVPNAMARLTLEFLTPAASVECHLRWAGGAPEFAIAQGRIGPFSVSSVLVATADLMSVTVGPNVTNVTLSLQLNPAPTEALTLRVYCDRVYYITGVSTYTAVAAGTSSMSVILDWRTLLAVSHTNVRCRIDWASGDLAFRYSRTEWLGPFNVYAGVVADAFTGTINAGVDTNITLMMTQAAASALVLRPSCTANGAAYGGPFANITVAVNATSATFVLGSSLTTAATGVRCSVSVVSGDSAFVGGAPATVGPFTVVGPAVSSSSSSSASQASSSSSTGQGGGCPAGTTCAAPASLRAGAAAVAMVAVVIGAIMH